MRHIKLGRLSTNFVDVEISVSWNVGTVHVTKTLTDDSVSISPVDTYFRKQYFPAPTAYYYIKYR